jgi:hypothetical protein
MDKSLSRDEHPCKEGPAVASNPSFTELAYGAGFGFCVFLESCSAVDDRPFVLPLLLAGVVELVDSYMKLPELAPARLILCPLRLSSCTHTKQQRGQIECRPNSKKQKMTESGRVDARTWNPSVKEGWEEVA